MLGPSGSGKTTVAKYMKEELSFVEVVSSTTREMREEGIEGVTYYYVDEDEFGQLNMIEEVERGDKRYGFTKEEIDYKLNNFEKALCIVDDHGIGQLKKLYDDVVVVYVYSTPTECWNRLKTRDSMKDAMHRMTYAHNNGEFSNHDIADYVINNKDGELDKVKDDINDMVGKEF